MDITKIIKYAKKEGFDSVKYLGKYKDFDLYKPLHDSNIAIGLPFYILVKDNNIELVTGKQGLEIQKYRVALKNKAGDKL